MTLQKSKPRDSVFRILGALLRYEVVPQTDLPDITGLSRVTITKKLKQLERLRLIAFVRVPRNDIRGRPSNHWRLSFRGILALFRELQGEAREKLISDFKREWIVFQEWGYIKQNELVKRYISYKISKHTYRHGVFLEDIFRKDPLEGFSVWENATKKEKARVQQRMEELDKTKLLREILGLHEIFYSQGLLAYSGLVVSTIMPYLVQNPVFKDLYEKEIERLTLNYDQLRLVAELVENPGKSEKITQQIFDSKKAEESGSIDVILLFENTKK